MHQKRFAIQISLPLKIISVFIQKSMLILWVLELEFFPFIPLDLPNLNIDENQEVKHFLNLLQSHVWISLKLKPEPDQKFLEAEQAMLIIVPHLFRFDNIHQSFIQLRLCKLYYYKIYSYCDHFHFKNRIGLRTLLFLVWGYYKLLIMIFENQRRGLR